MCYLHFQLWSKFDDRGLEMLFSKFLSFARYTKYWSIKVLQVNFSQGIHRIVCSSKRAWSAKRVKVYSQNPERTKNKKKIYPSEWVICENRKRTHQSACSTRIENWTFVGSGSGIVARFFSSIIRIKFRTAHNPPEIPPPPRNREITWRILNRQRRRPRRRNPSQILPIASFPSLFFAPHFSLSLFCPPRVDSGRITFQRRARRRNVGRILAWMWHNRCSVTGSFKDSRNAIFV